jgi:hypothetical protein
MGGNPDVSDNHRALAKHLSAQFGGHPSANQIGDQAGRSFINVMQAADSPRRALTSYATFGLSDHPNKGGGKKKALPVEIVGACGSDIRGFEKAISTAAFNIINSHWPCFPGAIFPECLEMYGLSETMKHFFFIKPCLWTEDLEPLKLGKKTITFLLAVPISEEERQFAEKEGPAKLDALLEKKQIDIPDLRRRSVV